MLYPILMSDILKIEHLTKHFVKKGFFSSKSSIVKAADDVSFSLKEGEVFVLAGESGSGKSTIARLIMKAIESNSGKIIFEGQETMVIQGVVVPEFHELVLMVLGSSIVFVIILARKIGNSLP